VSQSGDPRDQWLRVLFSRRMIVALVMGFACGLPLHLTLDLLKAWMKDEGVDLTVIGLMALVGLPYTLKFLWAPLLDRFTPTALGRRRSWLLIAQISLIAATVGLGLSDPGHQPVYMALMAFFVTFFSATQDIVVDAYRREDLADEELGLGSALYVNGYRVGMLLAGGGGLILADSISFTAVYLLLAACMLPAVLTTLLTPEPPAAAGSPATIREAVIEPLAEYFRRNHAVLILAFILLYKLGDTMAAAMATPFYLDIGFSKSEIGTVVKLFAFWATLAGSFLGGLFILRIGIYRSLWIFGFFQAISTAGFALLARIGSNLPVLAGVISFENFSSGMGTSAFVAFMASITHKKFTATQYALLTSLMGVPRVMAAAPTGFLAKTMGWEAFFLLCTFIAVPGLALLVKFAPWSRQPEEGLAAADGVSGKRSTTRRRASGSPRKAT
jgi:PAT family beta-lactamase induction signal transducer AmpG